jgi:predicted Zn-dependent protease with MMP-like domain
VELSMLKIPQEYHRIECESADLIDTLASISARAYEYVSLEVASEDIVIIRIGEIRDEMFSQFGCVMRHTDNLLTVFAGADIMEKIKASDSEVKDAS